MVAGAGAHLFLHWKWMVSMTKRTGMKSVTTRLRISEAISPRTMRKTGAENGASAVQAASGNSWGPDDAMVPAPEWKALFAGESNSFAFSYAGDGCQITVQLQSGPGGSVGFVIWTPDQVYHWGLGEYVEPVGRGSVDPSMGDRQAWSGTFERQVRTTVVEHTGNYPDVSYYFLSVDGDGITLTAPAVETVPSSLPTVQPEETVSRATSSGDVEGKLVLQTTLTDRTGEWEIWAMGSAGSDPWPLFDTELDGLMVEYSFNEERALDWTW